MMDRYQALIGAIKLIEDSGMETADLTTVIDSVYTYLTQDDEPAPKRAYAKKKTAKRKKRAAGKRGPGRPRKDEVSQPPTE